MEISTLAFTSRGVYTLRPFLPTLNKHSSSPKLLGLLLLPQAPTMGPVGTLSRTSSISQVSRRPGQAPPLPIQASQPPCIPQMAVSQRTVCCRRQGGVPDLRGSGPRRQLGRIGMLSCLQSPRSGRWRALISLHTQRLRSITSSSLPSRSRAGWGGRGRGSTGWVCVRNARERKICGTGRVKDLVIKPTAEANPLPGCGCDGDRTLGTLSPVRHFVLYSTCLALRKEPFKKLSSNKTKRHG